MSEGLSSSREVSPAAPSGARQFDAVVVGAGFAGLYMLHRLRELGFSVRVLEAGSGVGGTWYWNRYPGARCDVESMEYSYQFSEELQQEWDWSERYASQPEILRYANHVADRFDLRRDIQFDTRVEGAVFDESEGRWHITVADGEEFSARFFIMATGCLSSANLPAIEGRDSFLGESFHTGAWPHEPVDFSGKRVGIIGTGSSAIQAIPVIAEQAGHLTVFQRTPNYSVPAQNGALDPEERERVKSNYGELRAANREMPGGLGATFEANDQSALEATDEELEKQFEKRWQQGGFSFMLSFNDLLLEQGSNDKAAAFVRRKIRTIVRDPEVAELLAPDQVVGCKRLCLDTNYFEAYNRPNVELVDIRESGVDRITAAGLEANGKSYTFDCLIFATGFDAMTGAISRVDIQGRGGQSLRNKWEAGPRTYLGLQTAGFPNLFTITGPQSPSVLTNMLPTIEQHVEWIADCIAYLREHGFGTIEATSDAENAWVEHVNEVAGATLYPSCNSWYLGANIPGKPRVFMPYIGFPPYVEKCEEVVANGYEGFELG